MDQPVMPTQRLFEADAYQTTARAEVVEVRDGGVILDRTVFYAESGGQPGDQGTIQTPHGASLTITDTQYLPGKQRISHSVDGDVLAQPGDAVELAVDWPRRRRLMRMHTALHVLCGLVGAPVTGCAIHADRARIDFDLETSPFSKEDLDAWLQEAIVSDYTVSAGWYDVSELAALDAEPWSVKPPAAQDGSIRVVRIQGLDAQPCGGTHVAATGELTGIHVSRIQKKSRHNRRITILDSDGEPPANAA